MRDCRVGRRVGWILILVGIKLRTRQSALSATQDMLSNVVASVVGRSVSSTQIAVVYRPPNAMAMDTDLLAKDIAQVTISASCSIIVGDFNLPKIDWQNMLSKVVTIFVGRSASFSQIKVVYRLRSHLICPKTGNVTLFKRIWMSLVCLTQCVLSPTCGRNILDILTIYNIYRYYNSSQPQPKITAIWYW